MFAMLAYWFQRKKNFKRVFSIGFYVKNMAAEGGLLGWRSGSPDTILKIDHLRTTHAMFALNWLTGFRGKHFKHFFPIGSYVKTMFADSGHLGWRSGSLNIILKVDHVMTIHAMFVLN